METGTIGLILLVALLVYFFIPRWPRSISAALGSASLWLWVGAMAFLLHNVIDMTIYSPALFYLFFSLAGSLAAPSDPKEP